jgi:hypothetical protein
MKCPSSCPWAKLVIESTGSKWVDRKGLDNPVRPSTLGGRHRAVVIVVYMMKSMLYSNVLMLGTNATCGAVQ